jgi:hypothetical protein
LGLPCDVLGRDAARLLAGGMPAEAVGNKDEERLVK